MLHLGFHNYVPPGRVALILGEPGSAPVQRLRWVAERERRLVDATQGRGCRAVVVTDSNHVILSAVEAEELRGRWERGEQR